MRQLAHIVTHSTRTSITDLDSDKIWADAVRVGNGEHVSWEVRQRTVRVIEEFQRHVASVPDGGKDHEAVSFVAG